jgi:hypothetical protein
MSFNLNNLLRKSNAYIVPPKPVKEEVKEVVIPEIPKEEEYPQIILPSYLSDEEFPELKPKKKEIKRKVPLNPLSDE